MTETECQERVRWFAAHAGLQALFLLPGQIDGVAGVAVVFSIEDVDANLETIDPARADDAAVRAMVERARQALAERTGCEIVHAGSGVFRCLRHAVLCETGEEQDPVIRQTLRWTACCPRGAITQTFYLPPRGAAAG